MKLPRVHRVWKGGKLHKYHRRTRAPLPLDVPEDHPKFVTAWTAEEARKVPSSSAPAKGTIAAACASFLASGIYRDMSEGYRQMVRRHVEKIREKAGTGMLADLRDYHIAADIDPMPPGAARNRLKAWRKLCAYWKSVGMIAIDPSRDVRAKPMPSSEGHKEWSVGDVAKFREHWSIDTPQRLAFELLQWTGARASDAVRLGPGMISDGLLIFRQQKTNAEAIVPWTSPAIGLDKQRADLLRLTAQCRHMVFIVTERGKPRSQKAFSSWFSRAASAAGLSDLSGHGLRKYRMNTLAEAGASVLQMQTWCGHLTLQEVEHYTRRAQRRVVFLGTEQDQNGVNQS